MAPLISEGLAVRGSVPNEDCQITASGIKYQADGIWSCHRDEMGGRVATDEKTMPPRLVVSTVSLINTVHRGCLPWRLQKYCPEHLLSVCRYNSSRKVKGSQASAMGKLYQPPCRTRNAVSAHP